MTRYRIVPPPERSTAYELLNFLAFLLCCALFVAGLFLVALEDVG